MNFLLDTNVISEPMKVRPNAGVLDWLAQTDEDRIFLSVVPSQNYAMESNASLLANVVTNWTSGYARI